MKALSLYIAILSLSIATVCTPVSFAKSELARVPVTVAGTTRLPLAPMDSPAFATLGSDALDTPSSGRIPNYLRALAATHPAAAVPFAHLFKTVVYGGTVAPETKVAMGIAIAKANGSDYLSAHLSRLPGKPQVADARTKIALRYAMSLTKAIHGVDDAQFAEARTVFNDAQLIELTMTTCFFNYFARYCQGAGLPEEDWIKETASAAPTPEPEPTMGVARIALASDAELKVASGLANPSPDLKKGLGIGVANSQRAMVHVPDLASAWWDYWKAVREGATVPREMQLQVSFAVSMANGCRYCTLHQVAGLRRLNVDVTKLQAMQKDDSKLTPEEKVAVNFARKLTKTPQTISDADFAVLKSVFPEDKAAMDILLQTCAFSFMNRFTDGLRLPSEDEAVKVYQEVYGDGAYKAYPMR